MKAIVLERYGAYDGLRYSEQPEPVPGPREILLQVHAAGLNPVDFKTVHGALKPVIPYRLPFVPGNECAGTVVAVGAAVRRFKVGDAVFARMAKAAAGAFAERVVVEEGLAAHTPAALDFIEAAAVPLAGLTAWQALFERARLRAGERVLIHAGAGGVGSMAIQLAKAHGAWVAATASAAKHDLLRELGADQVIDYRRERFEEVLSPVDVVFDTIAGDTRRRSYRVLKRGGRMVSIAGLPDAAEAKRLGLRPALRLVLALAGLPDRMRAAWAGVSYSYLFMEPSGEQLAELARLIDAGSLRPVLDRTYPLTETAAAMAYLEQGHAQGKVVLEVVPASLASS